METTKKRAVLPAIFFWILALSKCFDLIDILSIHYLENRFSIFIIRLLFIALYTTFGIFLIMGKKGLPLTICTGVMTLWSLYNVFTTYLNASIPAFIALISNLAFLAVWALITFVLLVDVLPALEGMKAKKPLFGKIFLITFIVFVVTRIVKSGFHLSSDFYSKEPFYCPTDFRNFLANVIALIPLFVALFTMALWISPAPKAERTVSAENAPKSEFYISIATHICLLLFTCGIWLLIWIHKATRFSNLVTDEQPSNPTTKLLLCMFVPFYQIYWTYKTAQRIDKLAKQYAVHSELGTACLLLAIFVPFIPPILMQDKINQIATKE